MNMKCTNAYQAAHWMPGSDIHPWHSLPAAQLNDQPKKSRTIRRQIHAKVTVTLHRTQETEPTHITPPIACIANFFAPANEDRKTTNATRMAPGINSSREHRLAQLKSSNAGRPESMMLYTTRRYWKRRCFSVLWCKPEIAISKLIHKPWILGLWLPKEHVPAVLHDLPVFRALHLQQNCHNCASNCIWCTQNCETPQRGVRDRQRMSCCCQYTRPLAEGLGQVASKD